MRAILIILAVLAHACPAWALDRPSTQVYCDNVRQAALDAQRRYVQIHTPRVDPVQTFNDSTSSCLDFISMFDIGFRFEVPAIGDIDTILQNMARQLLQRACQAATTQFSRAVGDAVQAVNAPLADVASVPGFSAGVTTRNDGGMASQRPTVSAVDRVINLFR